MEKLGDFQMSILVNPERILEPLGWTCKRRGLTLRANSLS